MSSFPQLLAIGGGGFSQQSDPQLESTLLALLGQPSPRIGYIGTANFDNFERLSRFHRRFGELGARTSDLPSSASLSRATRWLAGLDALFVAGGNTRHLLNHWRSSGQDELLREAALGGLFLSGVSAGAVCWFDYALSEARGRRYEPLPCLGIFSGSCCPHYSTEHARQPEFEQHIAAGTLPDGIGIDDGAAVVIRGATASGVYSAREGAGAVMVQRREDSVSTRALRLL